MSVTYGGNTLAKMSYGDKTVDRVYYNNEAVYKSAKDTIVGFNWNNKMYIINKNLEKVELVPKLPTGFLNPKILGFDMDNNIHVMSSKASPLEYMVSIYDDKLNHVKDMNITPRNTASLFSGLFDLRYLPTTNEFICMGQTNSGNTPISWSYYVDTDKTTIHIEKSNLGLRMPNVSEEFCIETSMDYRISYGVVIKKVNKLGETVQSTSIATNMGSSFSIHNTRIGEDSFAFIYPYYDKALNRNYPILEIRKISDLSLISSRNAEIPYDKKLFYSARDNSFYTFGQFNSYGYYVFVNKYDSNGKKLWGWNVRSTTSEHSEGMFAFDDEELNCYLLERDGIDSLSGGTFRAIYKMHKLDKTGKLIQTKELTSNIVSEGVKSACASYRPFGLFYNKYWK